MSMIEDKIDFVDGDYENCRQVNVPRQIKTRKSSFGSIFDRFTQYRLKKLEKKLDKMKEDALTAKYSMSNFDTGIEKKATSIAELEKKIMVLSKEDVPTDYVKRRAIKLKNKMAANLSYNSNSLYSVGLDKKNEVFASSDASEVLNPIEDLEKEFAENRELDGAAAPSDGLTEEERKVQAEVAKTVSEILDEKEAEHTGTISSSDVRDVVNETFDEIGQKQTTDGAEVLGNTAGVLGSDDVRAAVNESFDELDRVQSTGAVINGNDVRAAVNESFAELDKNQLGGEGVKAENTGHNPDQIDVAGVLSPEEVRATVNEAFAGLDLRETQNGIPEITEPFSVRPNTSNNSNAGEVLQDITPVSTKVSKEEIEAAINEVIDRIKLSKGNGAVKFDRFNEDGTRRERVLGAEERTESYEAPRKYTYTPVTDEEIRQSQIKLGFDEHGNPVNNNSEELKEYTYTPMTDEEIRQSQIKLGFDEHGNLVNPPTNNFDMVATAKVVEDERSPLYEEKSGTSLRDTVVVAPERTARVVDKNVDLLDEYGFDDKGTYVAESSFIPSEAHIKSNVSTKIEDYNTLKEKILQLQKQQALTEQKKADAQRVAEEAAARALQAKKEFEASQKSVSQSMEMLKAYTEALEEDCFRNERTAEVAENDARMNLNFVDVQMEKVAANDRLIEEIDSLIGPRAVAESIKTR